MKKFKFSLERLLKVRSQRAQMCSKELFKNAHAYQESGERERAIREQIMEAWQAREKGDVKSLALHAQYLEFLEENLAVVQIEKEEALKKLKISQQKTSGAIRERKIVEKFKEKKYSQWEIELEKNESNERVRDHANDFGPQKGIIF